MSALLRVEMRRLVSRRLFRVLTLLALLGIAIAGIATYLSSDNSRDAVAAARRQERAAIEQCIAEVGRAGPEAPDDPEAFCRENVWVEQPQFEYHEVRWILATFGVPLIMLGWLVGASFVGAEWHHRTMTTTLTWDPRRTRVLATKALAAILIVFCWILLIQVVFAAALYPTAALKGSTSGLGNGWWGDLALQIVRCSGIAAGAAAIGFAIASLGRNTAAALGVGFVYLSLVEGLIRAFRPRWINWLVGDNAMLVLVGPEDVTHVGHSQGEAALLLTCYAALAILVALAVFRRRDLA